MNTLISGSYDGLILLLTSLITLIVMLLSLRLIKAQRLQMMIILMLLSVFFYSGYGISYVEVSNTYLSKYTIFIICLVLPFIWCKSMKESDKLSSIDIFLFRHYTFVRFLAFVYLLCNFIPLVYPRFKLFDIFSQGFQGLVGFYDLRMEYKSTPLITITDAVRIFVQPFFFAYLIIKIKLNEKAKKVAIWLFASVILMHYMRYFYLSRYQMVIYGLLLYLLAYSVNGYKVEIKYKHIATILIVGLLAIPMLYAFTFVRTGESINETQSYWDTVKALIDSEAYYPIYYHHIETSPYLNGQTGISFILWILFLPIPSFLWPGKPTISQDAFTFSISGLHYGDEGYSSSLSSVLGESFMFFGSDYYWVQALIMSFLFVVIIRYLMKHKTLVFYSLYLIVFVLTLGRGGAGSYMSTIINGSLAIFLLSLYLHLKKI